MMHDFTRQQLSQLEVANDKPLVICDVDEVIVHFTRALEVFLSERQFWLDTSSFAISGNIKSRTDNIPASDEHVSQMIDQFFVEKTAELEPIDDAVSALAILAKQASVVLLTNLPHHARDKRIHNMKTLGITYPVITNSGPKGPAVSHLSALTSGKTVFIDDSPGFVKSAHEHAPHVYIVHFLQDQRFARHLQPFSFAALTTSSWAEALPFIQKLLT